MGFKYYEQNQLMIPMEWKTLIEKDDIVFVLNDLIDNMNIDKLLETYSPLGSSSYSPKMMLKILMYGYIRKRYSSRQIAEAVQCDIKFIWLAGENRNSYSKTDPDATFMHMKEDHMRNGQLKPGYNIQVGSCNGFVVNWSTHQNRNDNGTLIPHFERYERFFNKLPKSIGADSGYGNQENYEYLKQNHIKNYIKYPLFHKEQTKKFKSMKYNWQNMEYDEINDKFKCPEGKELEYIRTRKDKTETGFI